MGLNQRVAVYDLGGGTFDISVLEIGKDIFEVLATCGDTFLGGDDFDDRIIDLLADDFVGKYKINPRNDPYAYEKLKLAAENAKKALSIDEETFVVIDEVMKTEEGETLGLERTITRSEFSQLTHDLVMRTFKVCDEALQQSDLTVRDLDGVILVGGPTRLPMIREAVTHYFQQEPRVDVDPDEVVSMGAAIHAASLVGEAPDSMLLDVTPLDLRIGVAGGLAEPVIERNTPVPIEQTRTFTTFQDHQESVQIRVYQGDHRQADENAMLGQFEFSGFNKGLRSNVKIDVTFEIDADGIVNVTASDQATGQQASTQITLSSGLAEEQMERIIEQDVAGRVATAAKAEAAAQKQIAPITISGDMPGATAAKVTVVEDSPFGDGKTDLSGGCDDETELGDVSEAELDLIDDDELIQLTQEADMDIGADGITLDMPADQAPDDDDDELFDTSGGDLAGPEIQLTDEEK
jgi:molecular chaperone DnaK